MTTYSGLQIESVHVLRQLRELIAALDRRVPQLERLGEHAIANDAAALRKEALERIATLERSLSAEPPASTA